MICNIEKNQRVPDKTLLFFDEIQIEVKSGKSGKMQSLHTFLAEKQSEFGIRTSLENFTKYDHIQVYPLYAIENIYT